MLALLDPAPGQTYVDCTAGLGGHAAATARRLGRTGTVVLNDLDPANLARAADRVRAQTEPDTPRIVALQGNFADLPRRLTEAGLAADMVLADLGFASSQVEDPLRGLSFGRDGPLDMRFDPSGPLTAADLVGSMAEDELSGLIRDFGEDREHRRIARRIVEERAREPIITTGRLAEVVRGALRPAPGAIDPATRTFQALRIAVNDELGSLDALLAAIARGAADVRAGRPTWLRAGARIAVIAFHSLEDRPVKQAFADLARRGLADTSTAKPLQADEQESAANPRSRSARLRAIRLH